jgi:hypothetical protein
MLKVTEKVTAMVTESFCQISRTWDSLTETQVPRCECRESSDPWSEPRNKGQTRELSSR